MRPVKGRSNLIWTTIASLPQSTSNEMIEAIWAWGCCGIKAMFIPAGADGAGANVTGAGAKVGGAVEGAKGAKVGAVVAGAIKAGGAVEAGGLKTGAVVAGAIKVGGADVTATTGWTNGGKVTGSKTTDGTVTAGITSTKIWSGAAKGASVGAGGKTTGKYWVLGTWVKGRGAGSVTKGVGGGGGGGWEKMGVGTATCCGSGWGTIAGVGGGGSGCEYVGCCWMTTAGGAGWTLTTAAAAAAATADGESLKESWMGYCYGVQQGKALRPQFHHFLLFSIFARQQTIATIIV